MRNISSKLAYRKNSIYLVACCHNKKSYLVIVGIMSLKITMFETFFSFLWKAFGQTFFKLKGNVHISIHSSFLKISLLMQVWILIYFSPPPFPHFPSFKRAKRFLPEFLHVDLNCELVLESNAMIYSAFFQKLFPM